MTDAKKAVRETLRKLGAPAEACKHCDKGFPSNRQPLFFAQLMSEGEPNGSELFCSAACVVAWCKERLSNDDDSYYVPMVVEDGAIRAVSADECS